MVNTVDHIKIQPVNTINLKEASAPDVRDDHLPMLDKVYMQKKLSLEGLKSRRVNYLEKIMATSSTSPIK